MQEEQRFDFGTESYLEVLTMKNDVLRLNQLPMLAMNSFCSNNFPDPLSLLLCLNWFKIF